MSQAPYYKRCYITSARDIAEEEVEAIVQQVPARSGHRVRPPNVLDTQMPCKRRLAYNDPPSIREGIYVQLKPQAMASSGGPGAGHARRNEM